MDNERAFEKLLWSIAFPGFAQFLNGKIIKGTPICLSFSLRILEQLE
jgi:TM2 domain-containing membrane protein YozV